MSELTSEEVHKLADEILALNDTEAIFRKVVTIDRYVMTQLATNKKFVRTMTDLIQANKELAERVQNEYHEQQEKQTNA